MAKLPRNRKLRLALYTTTCLLLLAILVPIISHWWVERTTQGCVYTDIAQLPANDVALLLRASRVLPNGRPNHYFRNRIQAAADLYHQGKVRYILASGDNHITAQAKALLDLHVLNTQPKFLGPRVMIGE